MDDHDAINSSLGTIVYPTPDEERELGLRARAGDVEARNRLTTSVLPWVVELAGRFHKRRRRVTFEDSVSHGCEGAMHASTRFDPDRGVKYVTYATAWIKQRIQKGEVVDGFVIRQPREKNAYRPAGPPETQSPLSLHHPDAMRDERGALLKLLIDTTTGIDPVANAMRRESIDGLMVALRCLEHRRRDILLRRAGGATLDELSLAMGLTKERIRQLEAKALARVRAFYGVEGATTTLAVCTRPPGSDEAASKRESWRRASRKYAAKKRLEQEIADAG